MRELSVADLVACCHLAAESPRRHDDRDIGGDNLGDDDDPAENVQRGVSSSTAEQAAMKCLYLVTRSLNPTDAGRAR
jgi:hypothetical protein